MLKEGYKGPLIFELSNTDLKRMLTIVKKKTAGEGATCTGPSHQTGTYCLAELQFQHVPCSLTSQKILC